MIKILKLWFLLAMPLSAISQSSPVKILFIGNSFVFSHNMPDLLNQLAKSAGLRANISLYYVEGKSVNHFINDPFCWKVINSKKWDYVVIQDNQRYYYDSLGKFDSLDHPIPLLKNNVIFQDSIKKLIPCVKIVYFAGWELKGGIPAKFPGDNTKKMIKRILANYQYLNSMPGVNNIIAPVGVAWMSIIDKVPYIAKKPYNPLYLYEADGRHPGWAGSYLGACVLFGVIFHQPSINLNDKGPFYKHKLDTIIKKIAWQAVVDSFAYSNLATITPVEGTKENTVFTSALYPAYQWYKDNIEIPGANNYNYTVSDYSSTYWVRVQDRNGCTFNSFPIKLTPP